MEDIETIKMKLFCNNIPCCIFWKDVNLTYRDANDYFLAGAGAQSLNAVIGKTDFDLPWAPAAKAYQKSDVLVLKGNTVLSSKESRWYKNSFHLMIVNKVPLKDKKDNIIGVLGIHQDITQYIEAPPTTEAELFSMLSKALPVSLTHREMECLSLWLSGYSIKTSATYLKVSEKSIEAYRKNIKDKMEIYHKYQLIDLMQVKGIFNLFLDFAKLILANK